MKHRSKTITMRQNRELLNMADDSGDDVLKETALTNSNEHRGTGTRFKKKLTFNRN